MTVFEHEKLSKLHNTDLLIKVAKATHEKALELITLKEIPKYYIDLEYYESGVNQKTNNLGFSYHEISRYSDGFGASLFIHENSMLLLISNHELLPETALENNKAAYLDPLIKGLPNKWDFVIDRLMNEEIFNYNQPCSIFWFEDKQWHITDLKNEILNNPEYINYRESFSYVDLIDLEALYLHAKETQVNKALIDKHFDEWRN